MAILVEPSLGNPLLRPDPRPGIAATYPASMPDALEPDADLAANETEANDGDEVDEDEDECGFADQTAPELLNEVIIRSGYLLKRGDKRKTWKKRWVVLRASRLAFYKNERVRCMAYTGISPSQGYQCERNSRSGPGRL